MTLLGHGVHISSPQPIPEAIAWHTVPAQLSALRKMLRDAQTAREEVEVELCQHLQSLAEAIAIRLKDLRQQTSDETAILVERFDALEQAGQTQLLATQERLDGLAESNKTAFLSLGKYLDGLDEDQQARLDEERKLTTQRLDSLEKAGQALACAQHDQLGELGAALASTFEQGLKRLDETQQARLDAEQERSVQQFDGLHLHLLAAEAAWKKSDAALTERIQQLEKAPLKRFWIWLTRKGRKNGETL